MKMPIFLSLLGLVLSPSATVSQAQVYNFTTIAGTPGLERRDGTNSQALFAYPWGVAFDGRTSTLMIGDGKN